MCERLLVDVGMDNQTIAEAELLERQVVLRESPLLSQQDLVADLLLDPQRVAHEVAELLEPVFIEISKQSGGKR